ncbi:hypothetical protein AKUH4B206J_09410 [Apilactobacillus kunkeei]|nr:hypothetical protein AKUH4B206J_09410 [Apilactobacillus kunkeei]
MVITTIATTFPVVISLGTLIVNIYVAKKLEKANIQYNINGFSDYTLGNIIVLEMFSSNDISCIVRLQKIELLSSNYEIKASKTPSDLRKMFIDNFYLKSHIISSHDICRFTILDESSFSLGTRVFNCPMAHHEVLKLSFKRYDGKKNIDILIEF